MLCYVTSNLPNFKVGHNMNISDVALLLAAGNGNDGIQIEYNKLACLLLPVGAQ